MKSAVPISFGPPPVKSAEVDHGAAGKHALHEVGEQAEEHDQQRARRESGTERPFLASAPAFSSMMTKTNSTMMAPA